MSSGTPQFNHPEPSSLHKTPDIGGNSGEIEEVDMKVREARNKARQPQGSESRPCSVAV